MIRINSILNLNIFPRWNLLLYKKFYSKYKKKYVFLCLFFGFLSCITLKVLVKFYPFVQKNKLKDMNFNVNRQRLNYLLYNREWKLPKKKIF